MGEKYLTQIRGHAVYPSPEGWRYTDNDALYAEEGDRPCTYCRQMPTPEGYDFCLAEFAKVCPDVTWACCGHGVEEGYIRWGNELKHGVNALLMYQGENVVHTSDALLAES